MASREALIAIIGEESARKLMRICGGQRIPEEEPNINTYRVRIEGLYHAGRTRAEIKSTVKGCSPRWVDIVISQIEN
jgi:hypothetical protein